MLGEARGLDGIQGTQHPPGSILLDTARATVMAGIEALPDHRVLLEVALDSPLPNCYDGSTANGSTCGASFC
jgi:hypothetical protein